MTKEQIIKSKERVKKRAEVFTPSWVVKEMLDLIPNEDPYWRYLEPACGNGSFLVQILERKLNKLKERNELTEFNVLHALSGIYGVDVAEDNVREARTRLINKVSDYMTKPSPRFIFPMLHILITNIIVGDMLNHKEDIVFTFYEPKEGENFAVYERKLVDMEGGN